MTKQKQVFSIFCKRIKNKKQKHLIYHQVFRPFAMRLEIELRCILFPLIILEMFLQLDWSPSVVNSIDWTWFGKAHTCLYKVPQLTVHVREKRLEVEGIVRRAPRQDCAGVASGQISECPWVAQPEPGLEPDRTSLEVPENSCAATLPTWQSSRGSAE